MTIQAIVIFLFSAYGLANLHASWLTATIPTVFLEALPANSH